MVSATAAAAAAAAKLHEESGYDTVQQLSTVVSLAEEVPLQRSVQIV